MAGTGGNWDGHLPSNPIERHILNAQQGNEDEHGNISAFIDPTSLDDDSKRVMFQPRRNHTGVKGVLADKRLVDVRNALQRQSDAIVRTEALKAANGAVVQQQQPDVEEGDTDSDFEDDEDFRKFKILRLKQMQQRAAASARLPTFGTLDMITLDDYVDVCEKAGSPQTYVVVHLQEDYLPDCVRLNYKLVALAERYDQVHFTVCSATEVRGEAAARVEQLPALIAYVDGEYVGGEYCVGVGLGDDLSEAFVEDVLRRMKVRLTASTHMRAADAAALHRLRELGVDEGDAGQISDREGDCEG